MRKLGSELFFQRVTEFNLAGATGRSALLRRRDVVFRFQTRFDGAGAGARRNIVEELHRKIRLPFELFRRPFPGFSARQFTRLDRDLAQGPCRKFFGIDVEVQPQQVRLPCTRNTNPSEIMFESDIIA